MRFDVLNLVLLIMCFICFCFSIAETKGYSEELFSFTVKTNNPCHETELTVEKYVYFSESKFRYETNYTVLFKIIEIIVFFLNATEHPK